MKVLFVCSGNTCRSPMAEGYLNSLHLKDTTAVSAGFGFSGDEVSENSVKVLSEIGIDISSHRSRRINQTLIDWADLIVCMTQSHKNTLLNLLADEKKITVLSDGISDPYLMGIEVYRNCRDQIIKAIDKLFSVCPLKAELLSDISSALEIEKIEKECFSMPWSKQAITDSFNASTKFFVCKQQNVLAGYMGLSVIADEGYITNIAVLKDYRKKGVATAILKKAINYCLENNLSFITLEVRKSNQTAIDLYTRFGFKQEGQRKRFYQNPTEDALIMTRRFD